MPVRYPRLAEIIAAKSLKRGQFTLASGRTSTYYIDGKLTSFDPAGATAIADAVLDEIALLDVAAIGGMDMGATPICGAVAVRAFQIGRPLPTFIVRKDIKAHGTKKAIEGPIPPAPAKVVMLDDVITSGGSLIKAIEVVQAAGYEVALAIAILDRAAGAAEAFAARGINYIPLLTLSDIGVFPEPAGAPA